MGKRDQSSTSGGACVSVDAPQAKQVFVAGTFNGWNPESHPLKRNADRLWVITLDLPPGRHEYKLVIDGQWCCEPGCDPSYDGCPGCTPNEFGTMNRVMVVDDVAP